MILDQFQHEVQEVIKRAALCVFERTPAELSVYAEVGRFDLDLYDRPSCCAYLSARRECAASEMFWSVRLTLARLRSQADRLGRDGRARVQ